MKKKSKRFAWIPTRLDDQTTVWLVYYYEYEYPHHTYTTLLST